MSDKYDDAINYLTENSSEICDAWMNPSGHRAGCLFQFATPTGHANYNGREYGCLTMIRDQICSVAFTAELTQAIRNDERIPRYRRQNRLYITVDALPVFAEWQRRLDKELNRV